MTTQTASRFAVPAARLVRPAPAPLRLPSAGWLETVDVTTALAHLPCARSFLAVLIASELADDLRAGGPWTVLVPTDAAFARMRPAAFDALFEPEAPEALIDLAEHHVARGAARLGPEALVPIVNLVGAEVLIGAAESGFPGAVAVVHANLQCRNGVVHLLDDVLAPPSLGARFFDRRALKGCDAA